MKNSFFPSKLIKYLAITALFLLLNVNVFAQVCTDTIVLPTVSDTFPSPIKIVPVPQFNPALGTLQSVDIVVRNITSTWVLGLESRPGGTTQNANVTLTRSLQLRRPDNTVLGSTTPIHVQNYAYTFLCPGPNCAYDGVIDFGGSSGITFTDVHVDTPVASGLIAPADLALFTGVGVTNLNLNETVALVGAGGGGNMIVSTQLNWAFDLDLVYTYCPATADLGDFVWEDLDYDGVQDTGEPGIVGVQVDLKNSGGVIVDTTTTGPGGIYAFTGITPGDYSVVFTMPAGYIITKQDQGGDDAKDSDTAVITGSTSTFTLVTGDNNIDIDTGMYRPSTISNFVWEDLDGDGIQDGGEVGIDNVTVTLRDSGGVVVSTQTTAGGGLYQFTNLIPGSYTVTFTTPAGYIGSLQNQGGDDNVDSDGDPTTGITSTIVLVSNTTNPTIDMGMYRPSSISNFVWEDVDLDGVQDGAEVGIDNVTVTLRDSGGAVVSTQSTAGGGFYQFTNLAPGNYTVTFTAPAGYKLTTQDLGGNDALDSDANATTGATSTINVPSNTNNTTIDAGMYRPATISNFVWEDADGDGIQDAGELGIDGVTVTLRDSGGAVVSTQSTSGGGIYLFSDLLPGNYTVTFSAPAGYTNSPQNSGADDAVDSDGDQATGLTGTIVVISNSNNTMIDMGMYQTSRIGNFVWEDSNGDGIQDPGEVGIDGVTITLKDSGGVVVDTEITIAGGLYAFLGLAPGSYTVTFTAPAGYFFTKNDQGIDENVDSDANPTTGLTSVIDVISGSINMTIDAGMHRPSTISNFVWEDMDFDGIQDVGEVGIDGVTVTLKDSTGLIVDTETTAGGGNYIFTGVAPGSYTVTFTALAGYTITKQDLGGDDTLDSDALPATGVTATIVVVSNSVNTTIDTGMFRPSTISNFVWEDMDFDGVQDAGEIGIDGVTVTLKDSSGVTVDTEITAGGGNYIFTGVVPGSYSVTFTTPAGYTITKQDLGGDDTLDSDALPATGVTATIVVVSNSVNTTIDTGMFRPSTISNFVWEDMDFDGVQDAGEIGIDGVTVTLKDSSGVTVDTEITAGGGNYMFTNVAPGSYTVTFTTPAGYTITKQDLGGNDALDSDALPASGVTATIVVVSNSVNTTIDTGMFRPSTISNFVWEDMDFDGVQDAGEIGIDGVTVTLKDSSGVTVDTEITAGGGNYMFTNVAPGSYTVTFTTPAGYTITKQDLGGNDALDSDALPASGVTATIVVVSNSVNTTIDTGMFRPSTISNFVWEDMDFDGVQDAGEIGIDGVTVTLKDSSGVTVDTEITAGGGNYMFTNVAPGSYTVTFTTPAGYTITKQDLGGNDALDSDALPASGVTATIVVVSNSVNTTIDTGMFRPSTISNFVWEDLDLDGIQDAAEVGIDNVTVTLRDSGGNVVDTEVTAGGGLYIFMDIPPGNYTVTFSIPAGYSITTQNQGADDTLDSDPDRITGTTATIIVTSNSSNTTIDAGMYIPSTISNFVWEDMDFDGVQDAIEVGIDGVTVTLKDSTGVTVDTKITAGGGNYMFTNVAPGSYTVTFTTPAGYTITKQDLGGNDTLDSDGNPATGVTSTITVVSNSVNTTIDTGMYRPSTISNFVWEDMDFDGIQDAGEVGIDGVTVTLKDSTGLTVDTEITAGGGNYMFTNVAPGSYTVTFTTPAGYTITKQDLGGDDTLDSDALAASGVTSTIVVVSNSVNTTIDTGMYRASTISNFVWEDMDFDGIQEVGESGIVGATVVLKDSAGVTIETQTTVVGGLYAFSNVAPGSYTVTFTAPTGYLFTTPNIGADDALDSDTVGGMTGTIITTSGSMNTTIDSGMYQFSTISNFVWEDMDFDGIQDTGEPGIDGVIVILKDIAGATIDTVTTSAGGQYEFKDIVPGIYNVTFTLPTDGLATKKDEGADDTVDSDGDLVTGLTGNIIVTSGSTNTTVDMGIYELSSIGDFVWEDKDGDGIQDSGETGIEGIVVTLKDSADVTIDTATTISGGLYEFNSLIPASYTITFTAPAGYVITKLDQGTDDKLDSDGNSTSGLTSAIVITSGSTNTTIDLGLYKLSTISNFVWEDLDGNGLQDTGEIGIDGVVVKLKDSAGVDKGTKTTSGGGIYSFTSLIPGTYTVTFVLPPDYIMTKKDQGGDDAKDSDGDPKTGNTGSILLTSGTINTVTDSGMYKPSTIGDFVWEDKNENGIQDQAEVGIANVKVTLRDVAGVSLEVKQTGNDGLYEFTNLAPGNYSVKTEVPTGYKMGQSGLGSDKSLDSDGDPSSGITGTIKVVSGSKNKTVDFGMVKGITATTGNYYLIYMLIGILLVVGVAVKRKVSTKLLKL